MKSVLDKPTLEDITNAYTVITNLEMKYRNENAITSEEFTSQMQQPLLVIRHNSLYLRSVKHEQYDFRNFEILMEEILNSGKYHFSMTAFFGWLSGTKAKFTYGSEDKFSQTTKAFNCNSVACIAGYASALAVNWNEKATAFSQNATNAEHWENIACNWLNIPLEVGEKIFYGNPGSVWSFAKTRIDLFDDLEWEGDSQTALEYDDCHESDYQNLEIDLSSISYKHSVEMLRMIKDGELIFDDDFEPSLTEKYFEKQS